MQAKQTILYKCSKCNRYYILKEVADSCCTKEPLKHAKKVDICEQCNESEVINYHTICEKCRELNRFNKAEKIQEFNGYVYDVISDEYYSSIEEMIGQYEDEYYEDLEYDLPRYVYATKEIKWEVNNSDVDNMLENSLVNHYEDASDHIVDLDELKDFIAIWNKKQTIVSYEPDFTKVILL